MVSGGVNLKNVQNTSKPASLEFVSVAPILAACWRRRARSCSSKRCSNSSNWSPRRRARNTTKQESAANEAISHLSLACEDYDRMRPLKDGIVKPEGIELNYMVMPVEEIFWRMMKYEEFDVSELSMGAFLTAASRGRRPFVAIPVFPSRTFRHRCIFVNTDSGIKSIQDLRGRRMGVPEYSMTAAVWLRGMFEHEYGVPPCGDSLGASGRGASGPQRSRRFRNAGGRDDGKPAGHDAQRHDRKRRGRRHDVAAHADLFSPRLAQGEAAVSQLPPGRDGLFQNDRLVPDHACDGDQTVDLRKRAMGGADALQSVLRVERNLHARSLRYQHTARRAAVDFCRVRRHHAS